jgi:hypothetical protein
MLRLPEGDHHVEEGNHSGTRGALARPVEITSLETVRPLTFFNARSSRNTPRLAEVRCQGGLSYEWNRDDISQSSAAGGIRRACLRCLYVGVRFREREIDVPAFAHDFSANETSQRKCALALLDDIINISLTIDGGSPIDFNTPGYEVCSPQRQVQLLADNFLGVEAQTATFTTCGWAAWLTDLPLGRHTIRTVVTSTTGTGDPRILVIDVRNSAPH